MIRHDSQRLRAHAFMYVRVCLLAIVFAVALATQSAVAQTTTPQYLFLAANVPNGQGAYVNGIITFTVNTTTGALTQITPPPVQTRAQPSALAINNAGTFLFAAATNSAGQGAVESFSVGSDGSLTEVGTSPYTVSNPQATPITLAVSPNGEYLYVASTVPGNSSTPTPTPKSAILDAFAIAAGGSLTLSNSFAYSAVEACNPPTAANLFPVQLYVHPTQKWLYLFMGSVFGEPCSGQPSEVQPFTINSDGTLTPGTLDILPLYATSGYVLTGSPDGTLLFLMTNPLEGAIIYASGIDQSTGDVSFALAGSYPPGPTPVLSTGGLAVDSTSTYLYSSAGTFQIQDGTLTALDSSASPYTGGASLLASPSLPLIFAQAVTQSGGDFLSDQVNSDGSLTPAPGSPYAFLGSGMVLSGAAPIPTKAVMWIKPDGPIDITGVTVGQTGSSNLTISNPGYGPLTITSVTVTGDPSLSQTNNCTVAPIAAGTGCQVTINFMPTSAGTFASTLTIESNTPTRTVAITSTSQNPAPDPVILPSQQVLLPDTAMGSSSSITIELSNYTLATAPLTVSGFTWTGSNPGDFSETNNCTSPIAVGAFCSINITFTPLALGGRTALLNIATNGGDAQATVSGTAVTTVTKFAFNMTVNGPGTVKQTPTGTSFPNNTTITVTATPNANSSFINWGAICPNAAYVPTCTVILNQNLNASANFATNVTLTTSVVGGGTILQQPTGTSFAPGSEVTLTAVPNQGQQFLSWSPSSGCFSNTPATECIVTLKANTTITATFTGSTNYTLTTNVSGPGTIMQSPTGTSFASGTAITLTAVPNMGTTFTSWSGGACSGGTSTTCAFKISANTSVTATFSSPPAVTTPTPSQTGAAGGSFTFPLSATGFSTTPTYTASCSIPAGSCTINGTTLVVATTSRTSMNVHQVTAWVGPSSGVGNGRRSGSGNAAARVSDVAVADTLLAMLAGMMLVTIVSARGATAAVRLRRMAPSLAGLVAFAGLALLVACGGSGGGTTPMGTPAGTYTVTVTATAGTQKATTIVSVTVQ
jgi:Lactonase, 7-bladed beta-propeller/Divergent InlB B-repeat domain/Abnormal spindle-like microcephaly-assoc'd, ASPM-SPD-2-Hydin